MVLGEHDHDVVPSTGYETLEKDKETLGKYLRALIFFGTPTLNRMRTMPADESNSADSSSHGFGVPSDLTDYIVTPLRDPRIPLESKGISFERWVSGYYDHAIPPDADLHTYTYDEMKGLLVYSAVSNPPPEHVATVDRLSTTQRADLVDETVTARSHVAYVAVDRTVHGRILREALWDSTVWPNLRVSSIWCDMSVPDTVLTNAWYVDRQLRENWPQGARKIDIVRFRGANHFVSA